MKITAEPTWNYTDKTVTLQLTDDQWVRMEKAEFKSQWHFLRVDKS